MIPQAKTDDASLKVYLARQPIVDRNCRIVGYELVFRNSIHKNKAEFDDPKIATLQVMANVFLNMGYANVLGNKMAFINFDEHLLKSDLVEILPHDKVVLEILETVTPGSELLDSLTHLREKNYKFALDDYIYTTESAKLVEFADIIKIDVQMHDDASLVEHVGFAKRANKTLLAEKVENVEQYELLMALGFNLFQGYFFGKPKIMSQTDIPGNELAILNVMNQIMSDTESSDLAQSITHDVPLSFKLLKLVNSAGLRRSKEITTISGAINLLGREQLYRWLAILLFTSNEQNNKWSRTLLNSAVYRGRLMELLGKQNNFKHSNELFLLGTFSYLDALLGNDMPRILHDLVVPEPIREALLNQRGPYWHYLDVARKLESGDTDDVLGLSNEQLQRAQWEANSFAESLSSL
ncbi:MAG: EAL domain-containing protein [Gammaproteobacteria bacterium]|nr:EAL domain-containing protein [Gammaproteobacteria bacterium]MDH5802340.1 EAL domain-containing protein [Gammaproteobacteria bacterium]